MGPLDIALVLGTAEDGDVKRRIKMMVSDPREDLESVESRDFQIEKNQVGAAIAAGEARFEMLNCGRAVDRVHDVAVEAALVQCPAEEEGVVLRILDQQNKWA